MQCPKCKSDDVVKLSVVHSTGLSDINASSRGHAMAIGDNGLVLGTGSFTTTGTSQTRLSKFAAPPRKKPYRYVLLAWLVGLAIGGSLLLDLNTFTVGADAHVRQEFHWFAYAFSFLAVLILAVLWRYNHLIFPRRLDLWNRSFMCRHCGQIFQPSEREVRA
jgi:hypothetical protein